MDPMIVWNSVLSFLIGIIGFFLKDKFAEVKRLDILLNKTIFYWVKTLCFCDFTSYRINIFTFMCFVCVRSGMFFVFCTYMIFWHYTVNKWDANLHKGNNRIQTLFMKETWLVHLNRVFKCAKVILRPIIPI